MRLCVIWILNFSISLCSIPASFAQEHAHSIDYVSNQRPLAAVLDHCQALADIHSSIEAPLLSQGINKAPVELVLHQANQQTTLQAICHSLEQKVWWYKDEQNNILFTQSAIAPFDRKVSNKIYHSNADRPDEVNRVLAQALKPWLRVPKAGIGYIKQQSQWSASLTEEGHRQFKHLLKILESQRSEIPVLKNTELKRVLPITNPIICTNWSDAVALLQRQLKCSISVNKSLIGVKQQINIPACIPEVLSKHLKKHQVHSAWIGGVLCIGSEPIQTWQHPSMRQSIVIPLGQFTTAEQKRIIEKSKQQIAPAYWQQDGCLMLHLEKSNSCLLLAHQSVITNILGFIEDIDSKPSLP